MTNGYKILLLIIISVILATGCTKKKTESNIVILDNNVPIEYSSEMAIENGDVVSLQDSMYNGEVLNRFIENLNNNNKDSIRVTKYNADGDPVIVLLYFNGEYIEYHKDNTREKNVVRGIKSSRYTSIKKREVVVDDEAMTEVILVAGDNEDVLFVYSDIE